MTAAQPELVVAGTYAQFRDYCHGKGFSHLDPRRAHYIGGSRDLYGRVVVDGGVVYVGTYYDRRDIEEIRAVVVSMLRTAPNGDMAP